MKNERILTTLSWIQWTPKEIEQKGKEIIATLQGEYEALWKFPGKRTFENTPLAIERIGYGSMDETSAMNFLTEISINKKIRDAARKIHQNIQHLSLKLSHDLRTFLAFEAYEKEKKKKSLPEEDRRLIEDMHKGFGRMGFLLSKKDRTKLMRLKKKIQKLSTSFGKNINEWRDTITLSKKETEGLPENFLRTLQKDRRGNILVSLDYPEIGPFMQYSPVDKKRKELSEKSLRKGGIKNMNILLEILSLREEKAKILGYKNHAEFATEVRMAKSPKNVMKLIDPLMPKVVRQSQKDLLELKKLKERRGEGKDIQTFDLAYYSRLLEKEKFHIDSEEIREYFPLEHVISKMFSHFEMLFGIKFEKSTAKLWHKDVTLYLMKQNGKVLARFFFDLFPREGKYTHAGCFDIVTGRKDPKSARYVAPLGAVVANFRKGAGKTPPLLSHGEVETLFHEFGHLMHFSFATSRHASQAGFNVYWDFVETPSQMFEYWTWRKETLPLFSKHYQTGEPLPKEMCKNILSSYRFMTGYHYTRQLILTLFDLEIHMKLPKNTKILAQKYAELVKKHTGLVLPKSQIFPAGFGHLIGYDAGYYSYLWAKVFAADVFSRFDKEGTKNKATGLSYRKEILEKGSSREEAISLKAFLKRSTNNKAFLKEVLG
ncbi:MAG: M3 family metallopeptidase [Patescibacteria group bacterium]